MMSSISALPEYTVRVACQVRLPSGFAKLDSVPPETASEVPASRPGTTSLKVMVTGSMTMEVVPAVLSLGSPKEMLSIRGHSGSTVEMPPWVSIAAPLLLACPLPGLPSLSMIRSRFRVTTARLFGAGIGLGLALKTQTDRASCADPLASNSSPKVACTLPSLMLSKVTASVNATLTCKESISFVVR
ncbi:hypothetical protein D5039_05955 [Verminephrobacter aporrectodeae subsp. tuberculatae]|uniref:Uncharacterized protein n=1 Tax=Verminephrobacter aporrectodeae subsp. tuberculatae TaxID=1110392 RepID=A0ABT3KQX9_9BURK|nr:hypothetical protein [Verminephrobacter aporrectodeae subsp. tuberculatae]